MPKTPQISKEKNQAAPIRPKASIVPPTASNESLPQDCRYREEDSNITHFMLFDGSYEGTQTLVSVRQYEGEGAPLLVRTTTVLNKTVMVNVVHSVDTDNEAMDTDSKDTDTIMAGSDTDTQSDDTSNLSPASPDPPELPVDLMTLCRSAVINQFFPPSDAASSSAVGQNIGPSRSAAVGDAARPKSFKIKLIGPSAPPAPSQPPACSTECCKSGPSSARTIIHRKKILPGPNYPA